LGVVPLDEARRRAEGDNLDLLLISNTTTPPVCKIVDFGQYKYQQQKKDKLAKKNVKGQVVKEVKLSPRISDHDYLVRLNRGIKFLGKGYKVKLTVYFKGRLMTRQELGVAVLDRFIKEIAEHGTKMGDTLRGHRSIYTMINPK
jgi:translation initiation factor IF-3